MMEDGFAALSKIVGEREGEIVTRWRQLLVAASGGMGRIKDAEVEKQCPPSSVESYYVHAAGLRYAVLD